MDVNKKRGRYKNHHKTKLFIVTSFWHKDILQGKVSEGKFAGLVVAWAGFFTVGTIN